MNDNDGSVTVRVHPAIAEIPAAAWDACAGDETPFSRHAFLLAVLVQEPRGIQIQRVARLLAG